MQQRPARLLVFPFAAVMAMSGSIVPPSTTSLPADTRPNVLIILTDDQRAGTPSSVMDRTAYWFADRGTRFINAYATTPVCCPSRASIMTGRYAHNHSVNTNIEATELDLRTTVQRYLRAAGYRTGIFGKFMNRWNLDRNPPHFDRWAICTCLGYFNQRFNVNGSRRTVSAYSTHYISDRASAFIAGTEASDARPWLAIVAPNAPHAPYSPEPRYGAAPVPAFVPSPAVAEANRSDKPPWVRAKSASLDAVRTVWRRQLRTLMSVDDMVQRLLRQTVRQGERTRTLAFYVSDNGYQLGEHGLIGKYHPYLRSTRIPLFMRWPGHVAAGVENPRFVANIDLAPTILDAAGIDPDPAVPMDGRSLLTGARRDRLLLEQWKCRCTPGSFPPTWASTRGVGYQYTEYYSRTGGISFREYYDLSSDRFQLVNLLRDGDPSNNPDVSRLTAQLRADRRCLGAACP